MFENQAVQIGDKIEWQIEAPELNRVEPTFTGPADHVIPHVLLDALPPSAESHTNERI